MDNKFNDIVTNDNLTIITSTLSAIDIPEKQKINLIETISNIIYLYEDHFDKYTEEEKFKAMTLITIIFDTLLDSEINPQARKYLLKALNCFNNNIFDVEVRHG